MSRAFEYGDRRGDQASHDRDVDEELEQKSSDAERPSPGKVPRTLRLQFRGGRDGDAEELRRRAARGADTSGGPLPHLDTIQRSFGKHDISDVRAHRGADARRAADDLGADAYAYGDDVVFGLSDDLYTAAHEAAHVVQQRAGVVDVDGGVGKAGDSYERHADAVADAVLGGRSAEPVLDSMVGSSRAASTAPANVQRSGDHPFELTAGEIRHGEISLHVASAEERGAAPGSASDYIPGSRVRISREGEMIFLTAPLVTWRTEVSLSHPDRLPDDDFVMVGPIQQLNSSTRTGIYKDSAGHTVAQHRIRVGNARDAMTGGSQRNNPPFYGEPESLDDDQTKTVEFWDSPMFRLPAQVGNGTLKEVTGEDRFTLSLGAKHEDTIIHIAPHDWSVSWNHHLPELPAGTGTGDAGREVTITPVEEGATPPSGPIVAEQSEQSEHMHYATPQAAAQVDYWTLVGQLEAAQRNDPSGAQNIIAGMLLQNPRARIKVQRVAETFSADDMVLHAWGAHRAVRSAEVSREHVFDIGMREMFHNRTELTTGSNINCTLYDEDHSAGSAGGRISFPYPFEPTEYETITASGIMYKIQLVGFGSRGESS
jgi:hypothetical protein